ncbi:hypothetical protein R2325_14010 [Mycobacteroides chelonae]|nr:hypothetical protein [Mycobacteroides chelonae]MEC4873140.1 hypothetical protein [Mycobacteroides chelonae]
MAAVQVTILNNSGQTVVLALDDKDDAERIEYFQTLKRRGDLTDVEVKSVRAPQRKTASSDAGDSK